MHERHAELFDQLTPDEQSALMQGLTALRHAMQNTLAGHQRRV
jgi:diadenosine tetraphosphate (Ap4A) HIT family hydrolase